MKLVKTLVTCLSFCSVASSALAAGSVQITYPLDLTTLTSPDENAVVFNFTPTATGNIVSVYVDDQGPIMVREVGNCPCTVHLPYMHSGKHSVAVKESTPTLAMTGVQDLSMVTVVDSGGGDGGGGGSD